MAGRIIGLSIVLTVVISACLPAHSTAENYVNWKGGFWLTIPEGWDKVDYRIVDRFLAMTDTSRDIFNYEVVLAPEASRVFAEDAYLVVTFDSTGKLSSAEADSVLEGIAESYASSVDDAPIVQLMSDLIPGQPRINREEKAISVLSEMAYRPEAMKKLWLYMKLNDRGLISLYFYSPDSTYTQNKPVFDRIVESLSFENLKEAAGSEKATFTDIGGDDLNDPEIESGTGISKENGKTEEGGSMKNVLLIAVVIIIVFGLIWNFVIAPRTRKKTTQSD